MSIVSVYPDHITVNDVKYKIPVWVVEHNATADMYGTLTLNEVLTGANDFDRIESLGGDFLESECFAAYASHHGIDEGDALIHKVQDALYAWFSDYKGEENSLCFLEPLE